ncbi:hypothetical protein RFI_25663 [Reticulomyxa filosa]|uniref:Uncharacterized protein n=1 Tax=Reticulomyxa filosa TaxID=46433 RepID=X6MCV1_RETFI|nr:hypothetical protein RFI_25663 [Reticulomyxa filosa]|eukprot:ETO11714.1 hypothetical protein RFI_25663 [Reticulomyxa filosa]
MYIFVVITFFFQLKKKIVMKIMEKYPNALVSELNLPNFKDYPEWTSQEVKERQKNGVSGFEMVQSRLKHLTLSFTTISDASTNQTNLYSCLKRKIKYKKRGLRELESDDHLMSDRNDNKQDEANRSDLFMLARRKRDHQRTNSVSSAKINYNIYIFHRIKINFAMDRFVIIILFDIAKDISTTIYFIQKKIIFDNIIIDGCDCIIDGFKNCYITQQLVVTSIFIFFTCYWPIDIKNIIKLGRNLLDISIISEYDKAIEYCEKYLKIRLNKLESDHIDVADLYNNLGLVY